MGASSVLVLQSNESPGWASSCSGGPVNICRIIWVSNHEQGKQLCQRVPCLSCIEMQSFLHQWSCILKASTLIFHPFMINVSFLNNPQRNCEIFKKCYICRSLPNIYELIFFHPLPWTWNLPGVLRSQAEKQWVGYTFCTTWVKQWCGTVNTPFEGSIRLQPTPLLGAGGMQEQKQHLVCAPTAESFPYRTAVLQQWRTRQDMALF